MTFDPNIPRDPDRRSDRPELRTTPETARQTAAWAPWAAVIIVLLVGGFIWMQMSGTPTDRTTTSSTVPPVTREAPAPTVPATPPATDVTPPAAPDTGGTQTQP